MAKTGNNRCNGFTLIELVVVIAIAAVITLGAGILLGSSQQNWGRLYGRVYDGSATDGFAAQRAFDAVCRKSSLRKHVLSEDGDSLELYYWDDASTAAAPENYARFYKTGQTLIAEYGKTESGSWQPDTGIAPRTLQLADGVETVRFSTEGTSVQLYLSFTDTRLMPVVCSSVRHNE